MSDPITDYIAALATRLRGPAAAKADLLAEARDGLDDAADAYAAAGHPDPRGRAVAEFGDLAHLARAYQAELGVAEGARALKSVLVAVPVMHALWQTNELVWIGSWSDFGGPVPAWYQAVAGVYDWIGWAVMGLVGVALLAGRLLSRRGVETRKLGRAAGFLGAAGSFVLLLNLMVLITATAHLDLSRLLMPLPCLAVGAGMFIVHGRILVLAHRSLKFTAG
ncbi:permease prefix domain 1-containing protein [Actinokineospora sp. NPDC004072]